MKNSLQWSGLTSVVISGSLFLASCGDKPAGPAAPPAVAVNVAKVTTGNATYYDSYPATATPLNQVDIKPQVSGN
ncbi:MAG: efflux RND transporter periplasmic adaptor subunit, partial [Bacteroidetes bacterium]|nr:efflux RND transporter periplasmic adaptor subunit [Bacteroidota bacterium]